MQYDNKLKTLTEDYNLCFNKIKHKKFTSPMEFIEELKLISSNEYKYKSQEITKNYDSNEDSDSAINELVAERDRLKKV